MLGQGLALGREILAGLFEDVVAERERDLVVQRQRADRHAGLEPRHLDGARVLAFQQQARAFHDVGREDPTRIEAARVVDDDGRLFDLLDVVEALGERFRRGLGTEDDLDQRHLVHRREEVQADELRRPRARRGEAGDRKGGGVRCEGRRGRDHRLGLLSDVGLDGAILEHRLDDQVAAFEQGEVGGGRDAREEFVARGRRHAPLLHLLVEQRRRVGLALVGRFLRGVEQHDLDADLGRDVGDACTHHAGAEHAELLHRAARQAFRPRLALVDGVELEPKRADHVLRHLRDDAVGEVARLDAAGGVEIHHAALEHTGQDVVDGRVVALALGMRHRRRNGEQLHIGGALGVTARPLEFLVVPGLHGLGVGLAPGLGPRQQLVLVLHQLVEDAGHLRFGRLELLAFEHRLQRGLDADQPRQALGAAAAGEQAQLHFRQAELGLGAVDGDAVVAGQRQFQSAAERGAVERSDHWPAALLQPAQEGLVGFCQLVGLLRLGHRVDLVDVGAGEEFLLAAGEDHALDGGIALDARERIAERGGEFLVEHVHRTARHVEDEGGDAVGIHGELDCAHGVLSCFRPALTRVR